jgi:hypothetical protein
VINRLKEASYYYQVKYVWSALFATIPTVNESIFALANSVPGFQNLPPVDQAHILEAAYFDIWLVSSM